MSTSLCTSLLVLVSFHSPFPGDDAHTSVKHQTGLEFILQLCRFSNMLHKTVAHVHERVVSALAACTVNPSYIAQVVLTVSQIMWCRDLTECLTTTEGSVVEEVKQAEQRCFQVSNSVHAQHRALLWSILYMQNLNKLAELVRGEMPKLSRNVIGALITIDVHARDIVTQMVTNQVKCTHNNSTCIFHDIYSMWECIHDNLRCMYVFTHNKT